MERAAGPLVTHVCEHMEAAVQMVMAVALPKLWLWPPPPSQVCAVQAAARVLIFVNWGLGFVLPMSGVIALEAWARRHHALRCLARPATDGREAEERLRMYRLVSGQGVVLPNVLFAVVVLVALALLWCLVTWLVV